MKDVKDYKNKSSGRSLLHYSVINCNFGIIQYLIETVKIDINQLDNNNFNALMLASLQNCDIKIVDYLVKKGINIKQKDNILNRNALMIAVGSNSINIVDYLLPLSFDVKYKDSGNNDCVDIAIKNSNLVILNKLLKVVPQSYIFEQIIYYLHYNYPNKNKAIKILLKNIDKKNFAMYRYTIVEHTVYNLNYEIFLELINMNIIHISDPKLKEIDIIKDLKENTERKIFNKSKTGFTSEQMYNIVGIYDLLFN